MLGNELTNAGRFGITEGGTLMNMSIEERNELVSDPKLCQEIESAVRRVCAQAGRLELFEDALQEAWVCSLEEALRFDRSSGTPFAGYLVPRARWAALRYCRRNSGAFSIPERMWRDRNREGGDDLSAALYPHSLDCAGAVDSEEGHSEPAPAHSRSSGLQPGRVVRDEEVWAEIEARDLRRQIARLGESERFVMERLLEGRNCAEIARELGVTRQRAHQIKSSAFEKIRTWMGERIAA